SVDGRLKLTEQGEVIAARYGNAAIALRELQQVTSAVLLASTHAHDEAVGRVADEGAPLIDGLAAVARRAYRSLVWEDPAFPRFFRAATPIGELSELRLGSRPAARGRGGVVPRPGGVGGGTPGGGTPGGGTPGGEDVSTAWMARLLDRTPTIQRSVALRNPYVDSLSELQVRLLGRLRATPPDDPAHARLLQLVQLTINGVAAGLQNTG